MPGKPAPVPRSSTEIDAFAGANPAMKERQLQGYLRYVDPRPDQSVEGPIMLIFDCHLSIRAT